jgi:hypothetical protein
MLINNFQELGVEDSNLDVISGLELHPATKLTIICHGTLAGVLRQDLRLATYRKSHAACQSPLSDASR